jgi:hypothetical protein
LALTACTDESATENLESNGLQEKSAIQIFQEGARTTTESTDVVATGKVPVDKVDSEVVSRFGGVNAESTVVNDDYTLEIKTNGSLIFVKADEEYWVDQVGKTQALKIGDKWARSPIDGPLSQYSKFVDLDFFFRASGRIKKGDEDEVNGRPAIAVIDPPSNTDSRWWFATTGDPVLLSYESGEETAFDFAYDQVVLVDLPQPAETVDVTDIVVPKSRSNED